MRSGQCDWFAPVEAFVDSFETVQPLESVVINRPQFAGDAVAIGRPDDKSGKSTDIEQPETGNDVCLGDECLSGHLLVVGAPPLEGSVDEQPDHGGGGEPAISTTTAVVLSRPDASTDASTSCWEGDRPLR